MNYSENASQNHQSNHSHINISSACSSNSQRQIPPHSFDSLNARGDAFKKILHSETQDLLKLNSNLNSSNEIRGVPHDSILDRSFSKDMAPLMAQAKEGVFDKLNESEDNIDAMIDDYKKELGLGVDMTKKSIKYRQGLKEQETEYFDEDRHKSEMVNKIQYVKDQAEELIKSTSRYNDHDDDIWSELKNEKHKLLQMVDEVLTSSERGTINQDSAGEIFKKFQSIRGKEKILEECGMRRRRSKVSLTYNSGTTLENKDLKYSESDKNESKISKNVAMLENVLLQSKINQNKDNSFGIDISSIKNGEFKKASLSNFISFNNGETMFVGGMDEGRKRSLPDHKLNTGKNNITFNGSSFFSKNSKESKVSSNGKIYISCKNRF